MVSLPFHSTSLMNIPFISQYTKYPSELVGSYTPIDKSLLVVSWPHASRLNHRSLLSIHHWIHILVAWFDIFLFYGFFVNIASYKHKIIGLIPPYLLVNPIKTLLFLLVTPTQKNRVPPSLHLTLIFRSHQVHIFIGILPQSNMDPCLFLRLWRFISTQHWWFSGSIRNRGWLSTSWRRPSCKLVYKPHTTSSRYLISTAQQIHKVRKIIDSANQSLQDHTLAKKTWEQPNDNLRTPHCWWLNSIYLSIYLSVCLSICLSIYPSIWSIYLIYLSIYPSI